MKKYIFIIVLCIIMPFNVLAYSNSIIPGGETLGIEVKSDGILIIGFYQINGKYNKGTPNIKQGDYITKVNDVPVNNIDELTKEIEKNTKDKKVKITYLRNKTEKSSYLDLIESDGIYKTGLYVKDTITGIGTLTYIDPTTSIYGALGHEIIESTTNSIVEIKSGSIFKNSITSIEKSSSGIPGSKNAKFFYNTVFGSVLKNTNYGIYGIYNNKFPDKELMDIALSSEVKLGQAYIYTVLKNNEIGIYSIEIKTINDTAKVKNISFIINDNDLIEKTGGIVQGMSGSPIIQDNKIVGAVTHVIIDDPLTGYGIFITTMLEEGEK